MKLYKILILILSIFVFTQGSISYGFNQDEKPKCILLITDRLDLQTIENISEGNKISLGIMNMKTGSLYKNHNKESLFMTIAMGRRIKVDHGLYKGLYKSRGEGLCVKGYEEIKNNMNTRYVDVSKNVTLLGQYLRNNGIQVGYLGNDSSALIAIDKDGYIPYGSNDMSYEKVWLFKKVEDLLMKVDFLVFSYDTKNERKKSEIIKDFIKEFSNYHIITFSHSIVGDIDFRWNTSLAPVLYSHPKGYQGALTSKTTRRRGVITNLDLLPTIAEVFELEDSGFIGNGIVIEENQTNAEDIGNQLIEFLNLNILKYLLHGTFIILEIIVMIVFLSKKQQRDFPLDRIMTALISLIGLSFVLGVFKLHRYLIVYLLCIGILSTVLPYLLSKTKINSIKSLSWVINGFILYSIFMSPKVLYDSYIGYNNIVAGGRFYGLNNEVMGVLLATTIINIMTLQGVIKNQIISKGLLLFYLLMVIIALSSKFGANFGGLLTAIALLLIMVYVYIFNHRVNSKTILFLIATGIVIFVVNIVIDLSSTNQSHGGSLINSMGILGYGELARILWEKLKQLGFMLLVPPWSIILIIQTYFITRIYNKREEIIDDIKGKYPDLMQGCTILFTLSIIALIVNDTGIIAFMYMNTFLISLFVGLHNNNKRTFP